MATLNCKPTVTDLASLVHHGLSILNSHRTGDSLGHPTPAPTDALSSRPDPDPMAGYRELEARVRARARLRQAGSPLVNNEQQIAQGHRERRAMLAQRRAEQQLTVLLLESQRLGVTLSTEAMARTCIAAYTDTMNCARR